MTSDQAFKLANAAKWSQGFPHQVEAWDWLQSQLPPEVLNEFKLRYRNEFHLATLPEQHRIPEQAIKLIQYFEGLSLTSYLCSAGVPTIGWGTTRYPDNKKVSLSDPAISKEQARVYLMHELESRIVPRLASTVPYWASMNANQRSALISFGYNLGENFMIAESGFNTIQRQLKAREWEAIPSTLAFYRNPGTSSEAGLLSRRKEEGLLWQNKGLYAVNV
jgi:GH24 family phage-related lysozyme (muramidase)